MSVEIEILKNPVSSSFVLISGLPGAAYIGKLAVDHLVQEFDAKLIGEVYSDDFPPYVVIDKGGLVELLRNELYWVEVESGMDIMFLKGNAQALSPEGQYKIVEKVLDWAFGQGLKRVFSLAAFVTDRPFTKPRVYAAATSPELLEKLKPLGATILKQGIIGGANGLIIGLAKKKGIEALGLLGETHGYQTATGQYLLDAKAAKEVLKVLSTFLKLKLDLKPLDKQVRQVDKVMARMAKIEKQMRQQTTKSPGKPSYIT